MANLGFGSPNASVYSPPKTQTITLGGEYSVTQIEPAYAKQPWFNKYWRPSMAWAYLVICIFDFVIFPMLWNGAQVFIKTTITQWSPMTLQGAGMIHLAFGAILGVSAYGRTKERMSGLR